MIEARFAQPIVFSETGCISLIDPVLRLPDFDVVGKPVEVEADGQFTVAIDERGVDRDVVIRIYDVLSNGTKVDRAVSHLARPPAINPEATPIPVAPIRFEGRVFAEGTVEAAAYCAMKTATAGSVDELQNLTLSDIRAVVTSGFAANFVAGGNREAVLAPIRQYRHAINGLVDPTKNGGFAVTAELAALRVTVDEEIDACLAGRTDLTSSAACATGPDFYRSWLYVDASPTIPFEAGVPEGFRNHLLAAAQDMTDAIARVDGNNGHQMALLKENYRLRLEIAADAIRTAVQCFGDAVVGTCDDTGPVNLTTDTGSGSIETLIDQLRNEVEAAETPSELTNAFFNRNFDIATNVGNQLAFAGGNAFFAAQPFTNAAQAAIQDDFTHEQIATELADAFVATQADVDATHSPQFPNAADRVFLAQIMYYTNASAVPLVIDDTNGVSCFAPTGN